MSERDENAINQYIERLLLDSPFVFGEYSICRKGIKLVSALAVKYKAISSHDFDYRLIDRSLNVKVLDLV